MTDADLDRPERELDGLRRRVAELERTSGGGLGPDALATAVLALASVVALCLPFVTDRTDLDDDGTVTTVGWTAPFRSAFAGVGGFPITTRLAPVLIVVAAVVSALAASRAVATAALAIDVVVAAELALTMAFTSAAAQLDGHDIGRGARVGSGVWLALLAVLGWAVRVAIARRRGRA